MGQARTRAYYINDAENWELLATIHGPTSQAAIDPAIKLAVDRGKAVVLRNTDGRNLAKYYPDGRQEYLGH